MPRFFIRSEQITEADGQRIALIKGDDAHHISRSLRMAVGETVELCDMQRRVYNCTLIQFNDGEVVARVDSETSVDTEPKYEITLYQALPKSDKMETIIQKSTECGVTKIVPFSSERCIVKLDSKDASKKQERWQKIAEGAAKQSGRGVIPTVESVVTLDKMLVQAKESSLVLFCYEGESTLTLKQALRDRKIEKSIAVIIGAEGGFSQREAEKIVASGAVSVSLGKRILRCETAGPFVLGCIAYETEF